MGRKHLAVLICLLAALCASAAADGVEGQISQDISYTVIQSPCVKLMTSVSNADIGCSTGPDGTTGAIFYINDTADFVTLAQVDKKPMRAVILPPAFITPANLQLLKGMDHVAGVVFLKTPQPTRFSPAGTVPAGSSNAWNPNGLNLINTKFAFPIILADPSHNDKFVELAQANNKVGLNKYPQHALHFYFEFGPSSLNSVKCLADKSCLPVGGQSVWSSLGDIRTTTPQKPVVLIGAPLDTTALFHEQAFGANAAVSGLVALLAAADALAKTDAATLPLQLVFGAFEAESFGRVGSRRFASELSNFTCTTLVNASDSPTGFPYCRFPLRTNMAFPLLKTAGIRHVLAVDQVGTPTSVPYFHPGTGATLLQGVVTSANVATGSGVSQAQVSTVSELPPSLVKSFQEFSLSPSVGVLSGYNDRYVDKYFQSNYDDITNVSPTMINSYATLLARSAYALATNEATAAAATARIPASLTTNQTLVSMLLQCLTGNTSCTYLSELTGMAAGGPLSYYPGVYNQPFAADNFGFGLTPSIVERFVYRFLAITLAQSGTQNITNDGASCAEKKDCGDKRLDCFNKKCLVSTSFYHDAVSMALTAVDNSGSNDWDVDVSKLTVEDKLYTEPYWSNRIGVTGYSLGDPSVGGVVFGSSVGVLLATTLAVYYFNKYLRGPLKLE